MTDYFALFDEPRRPWLEPETLRAKFLALTLEIHPDKQNGASEPEKLAASHRSAEWNAAYNCLAEPKLRLLHLLQLERGVKPPEVQQIPSTLADLFAEVAKMCRNADRFLAEKNRVASPLLQVQLFQRAQEWAEQLRGLQTHLAGLRDRLTQELKSLDAKWMSESSPDQRTTLLNRLEVLYRLFGYFHRWHSQIQERIVQLSL